MNDIEKQKKIEELFSKEDFCVSYFDSLDDTKAIKDLLANNGLDASDEEMTQLIDLTKQNIEKKESGELTEEDLKNVNGGLIGWVVAGAIGAVCFGYGAYQGRKVINMGRGQCKR